ncbi:MAG: YciI family protein [Thermoanaerobaculia bacterium]
MKFLVLAYGAEKDWLALSEVEQQELLAADNVLRARGDFVAALENAPLTVRSWDGTPNVTKAPYAVSDAPLAGFGIIEAESLDEVVKLVANTPCARARGAVEVRRIL